MKILTLFPTDGFLTGGAYLSCLRELGGWQRSKYVQQFQAHASVTDKQCIYTRVVAKI